MQEVAEGQVKPLLWEELLKQRSQKNQRYQLRSDNGYISKSEPRSDLSEFFYNLKP